MTGEYLVFAGSDGDKDLLDYLRSKLFEMFFRQSEPFERLFPYGKAKKYKVVIKIEPID